MKIATRCPFCAETLELSQEAIDRRIRCPKCRMLFKIPHEKQLKSALDKIKQAKTTIFIDSEGNIYA